MEKCIFHSNGPDVCSGDTPVNLPITVPTNPPIPGPNWMIHTADAVQQRIYSGLFLPSYFAGS